ncbi:GIY-YIG nuclease family protein [Fodinibius halophilus]|uniref:GIY-YIG nuclease family protein n=1 Tax=Fodinibius halophilus TaxID=1736908 RepID=A0A6M1T487_9BACT|nr:GIY-YIG nuclease family protein [Fodinibius halophilus]NGP90216.1 GIY-YIG nuclease family protein [Fodinibius halophilus]
MSFHYVYLLESKNDGNWYTGYTRDLRKRLQQHRQGKVPSTKHRLPITLIYFEGCKSKSDALAHERYLKSGPGKRYLRNRLKRSL